MKILNRTCPICSCETGEILHHQKFQLSDSSLLPHSYNIVACNNCGFVFADTALNQEGYNKYYTEHSKYEDINSLVSTGGGTSAWDKKRLEHTAMDITKYCPKDASILDIGCANGGLPVELKKIGYTNLHGLDPSKACVDYVNNSGITCYLGELFEAEKYIRNRKFDFLILSHVLEHIYDLKRAVLVFKNLLTKNGLVYVEVPDAAHYSNYYIVPYYYFDSEHINHFDNHSMTNLFQSAGFELVDTKIKSIEVNDTTKYPAAYGVFKKGEAENPFSPIKDETVKKEIQKYIELSVTNSSFKEIEGLVTTNEPVVIFGAGNFTARLLESTPLKQCNIVAFVDNDRKKQGTTFKNKPVYPPDFIKQFTGTIVICSALFYDQIVEQLKRELKVKNNTIIIR